MKAMKQSNNLFVRYKKWWIIGAIVTVIVVVAGLAGWSAYAWNDYEKGYTSWRGQLHQETDRTFALKASTTEEKAKKIARLSSLQVSAQKAKAQCEAYGILHWQQFIPAIKAKLDQCQQAAGSIEAFAQALRVVNDHLSDEKKLTTILTGASTAGEVSEAAWIAAAEKWSKAMTEIEKLKVVSSLTDTKKVAAEKAKAIHEAWQTLIQASKAKDRQKYEATIDLLDTLYGGLDQIQQASAKSLQKLADTVQASRGRAFPPA